MSPGVTQEGLGRWYYLDPFFYSLNANVIISLEFCIFLQYQFKNEPNTTCYFQDMSSLTFFQTINRFIHWKNKSCHGDFFKKNTHLGIFILKVFLLWEESGFFNVHVIIAVNCMWVRSKHILSSVDVWILLFSLLSAFLFTVLPEDLI